MKEFINASVTEVTDLSEGVFAGSGAIPTPPGTEPTPTPTPVDECWTNWECRWDGHNSGGHSVCHVSANHCGNHSGECLIMNFRTNFPIKEVKNASGFPISNVGTHTFTLTRNNHFNPGENIGFCFEIVTSADMYDEGGNKLHGAIGANNGAVYYCSVESYECR